MRRKPVIHLLRRCLILLAILVVADRIVGAGLERMFFKQRRGDDAVTLYTLDSTREDLLIFGSSRASHHYHTRLLERELAMPVYNCGRDEMGISFTTAVLPLVYRRHAPKYIIVEVLPTELASLGREESERHISTVLQPYATRYPSLWQAVAYAGKAEVYKSAVSKIYPFNSLVGGMIQNTYTNLGHTTDRGYEPLWNSIDSARYTKPQWKSFNQARGVDRDLAGRFMAILDYAARHDTKAFVIISPFYFRQDLSGNESMAALSAISAHYGATFLDFSFDPRFVRKPVLFNDDIHLNDSGARVYTRIVADTLRTLGVAAPSESFAK